MTYNAREDPLLFSSGDTEMLNKKYSGVSEFALNSNLKAQFFGIPPFFVLSIFALNGNFPRPFIK